MSLRLEITLLTTCLRRQSPKSWVFVTAVSMWIESLLVTMRFLRTQTGNSRIWSDWKCNGLLPLVVLALSGPEEAVWWLLSQLLRYFFLCNLCKLIGRIGPSSSRTKKSLFPHWPTLQHLFCYIGIVILREGTSWLLFIVLWLTASTAVRTVLRNVHGYM